MKDKFTPFLDQLLPILTKYLTTDIDINASDAVLDEFIPAEKEEKSKKQSFVLNLGANQTKLSLNTFALQNKILSYSVLYEIAKNMETAFGKYVQTLLELSQKRKSLL